MKKLNFIFLTAIFSLVLLGCKSAQSKGSTVCKGKTVIQKEGLDAPKADAHHIIASTRNYVAVTFVGDFINDTLSLYVDNKLHSKINPEQISDLDGKSYVSGISKLGEAPMSDLRIESAHLKTCITVPLDWNYPVLYVWREKDKWIVRYSNFYHSDNLNQTKL